MIPVEEVQGNQQMLRDEKQCIEDLSNLSQEEKERKLFVQDLNRFMCETGKPLTKIPIMGYKELDLYQLFKEVMTYGGFNEVVKNVGTWSKIWKRLGNFDPSITDSSFRLKKNYERYLLEYEYQAYPEHRKHLVESERPQKKPRVTENKEEKTKTDKSKKSKSRKLYNCYKDIVREKNGQPLYPIILGGGDLIIENLGTVNPRAPYVTEKHIWPIGFTSVRYFSSMKNPDQRVKYTSQIVDTGDRPQFIVTAADEPESPILSHSPSGAWRSVLKRVLGKGLTEENKKNISVSGALRFGLAHPVVSHLIRELPGANIIPLFSSDSEPSSSPGSPSGSPVSSPSSTRKRKSRESSPELSIDTELTHIMTITSTCASESSNPTKILKTSEYQDCFSARDVQFLTRQEIDDLETAVATLEALKYCTVF